jgi:hypothetical protein
MTAKAAGRTTGCSKADAEKRLDDSRAFLLTAQTADNDDVVTTNAIHAAIAAADVLCCITLGERSSSPSHTEAVELLRQLEPKHANTLARCLKLKTRAAYDSNDVSARDAARTVRNAQSLVDAAEQALLDG